MKKNILLHRTWFFKKNEPWVFLLKEQVHGFLQCLVFKEEDHTVLESHVAVMHNNTVSLECNNVLDDGYYLVKMSYEDDGNRHTEELYVVVVPEKCWGLESTSRLKGVWLNAYSLKSARQWGVGDFTDVLCVVEWASSYGLDFVGLNPLHALKNTCDDISPYSPVSRMYRNGVYIDVESVAYAGESEAFRAWWLRRDVQERLRLCRQSEHVCYDEVWKLKKEALYLLFLDLLEKKHLSHERSVFEKYVLKQSVLLEAFCGYMHALEDKTYPPMFYAYVQHICDVQLRELQLKARGYGMKIGLYQDIAVGSDRNSFEVKCFPQQHVLWAHVGAPADAYCVDGQNWGFPPMDPHDQDQDGYRLWRSFLRSAMEHAGAVRIDHVMSLKRLFWIPENMPAKDGRYMDYPMDALMAFVKVESHRYQTCVVGEDLGTVPEGFSGWLESENVLSTRVVFFERGWDGYFYDPSEYKKNALLTLTTHDFPPLKSYIESKDIFLLQSLGRFYSDEDFKKALEERKKTLQHLFERLVEKGFWVGNMSEKTHVEWLHALHAWCRESPCKMLAYSLDDIAGESVPVNIPGIGMREYRNWSRRMGMFLEEICSKDYRGVF